MYHAAVFLPYPLVLATSLRLPGLRRLGSVLARLGNQKDQIARLRAPGFAYNAFYLQIGIRRSLFVPKRVSGLLGALKANAKKTREMRQNTVTLPESAAIFSFYKGGNVYKITTEVTVLRKRKHQVTMKTGLVGATSVAMLLHDLKHLPIDAVLDEVRRGGGRGRQLRSSPCFPRRARR